MFHCSADAMGDVVRALLDRHPTLRLPPNVRRHLSLLFARLNNCEEVLRLVRIK